jgi:hypothetical protein
MQCLRTVARPSNHEIAFVTAHPGHETLGTSTLNYWRIIMAKRGRKKRDRKHSKANHGKRPNCGSKAVK